MVSDPSPLKYMGTQSQETVNMAAAMVREAARGTEQVSHQTTEKLRGEVDKASSSVADAGSKIRDAANWAVGKAEDTARAAADQVRERATMAIETYAKDVPIRAILIAGGTGALLIRRRHRVAFRSTAKYCDDRRDVPWLRRRRSRDMGQRLDPGASRLLGHGTQNRTRTRHAAQRRHRRE